MEPFVNGTADSDLVEEYFILSQSKSFSATYILIRDINYLQTKIAVTQQTVDELRRFPGIPELEQVLVNYGFDPSPDNLDDIIYQTRTDAIDLEQLIDQWEQEKSKVGESKPTLDYFYDWLQGLSTDSGYEVRAEQITIAQFCRRCNKLQEKYLHATRTADKQRSR